MEHQAEREQLEHLEKMEEMEQREIRDLLVHEGSQDDQVPRDLQARQEWQGEMANQVLRVTQELMENQELLALRDHLVTLDRMD